MSAQLSSSSRKVWEERLTNTLLWVCLLGLIFVFFVLRNSEPVVVLIEDLRASPDFVSPGDPVNISWVVADGSDVYLSSVGSVDVKGSVVVYPGSAQTFTLEAQKDGHSESRSVHIRLENDYSEEFSSYRNITLRLSSGALTSLVLGVIPRYPRIATISAGGKQHIILLQGIASGKATLETGPWRTVLSMEVGSFVSLDADADGVPELSVRLDSISEDSIKLVVGHIKSYVKNQDVTEKSLFSIDTRPFFFYFWIIVIFVLLVGFVAAYIIGDVHDKLLKFRHGVPPPPPSSDYTPSTVAEGSRVNTYKVDTDDLDYFIEACIDKGMGIETIRMLMSQSGWKQEQARIRIAEYIIKNSYNNGYTLDEIETELLRHGWSKKVVEHAVMNIFRRY